MTTPDSPQRIVIVGGGASGTLLAIQLLRRAEVPLEIRLIERSGEIGRGVAYRTRCPDHLLNVPARRMSAFPDEPDHFFRWLSAHADGRAISAGFGSESYVPRQLFGDYLCDVYAQAKTAARPDAVVHEESAEIVDLALAQDTVRLRASDGREWVADQVVLAIGNLPGEYPIPRPLPLYRSPRYVHVPWQGDALAGVDPEDDLLLVGQGSMATDLIVQLGRRGHRGTIHALSRHGIRPQVQSTSAARPWRFASPIPIGLRSLVRWVRGEIGRAREKGFDWRDVIDALRPHGPAIWQQLSWEDRGRFMRFVRPLWEAHRHRIAPATATHIERFEREGRLRFYAGRLQELELAGDGVEALLRRRGTIQHVSLHVAKVINCTGSRTDYSKYQHPLFIHLLSRCLIDHDPLALGINALPNGEILRYRGGPLGRLFTLGPPLKGVVWESTAIAEIRQQAAALADRLLESGGQRSAATVSLR